MKTPGSNYKMSKAGKIALAVNWNRPDKRARRKSIIQAELYGSEVIKSKRERTN